MTRSDLVEELAARFPQLTHRDAEFAVKALLDAMSDALVKGHRIELRGFGSFSVNRRPPRMGRNPRSGESVAIPEKRVPHFKQGKALREAVEVRTEDTIYLVKVSTKLANRLEKFEDEDIEEARNAISDFSSKAFKLAKVKVSQKMTVAEKEFVLVQEFQTAKIAGEYINA